MTTAYHPTAKERFLDDLITKADKVLYTAKNQGRDRAIA